MKSSTLTKSNINQVQKTILILTASVTVFCGFSNALVSGLQTVQSDNHFNRDNVTLNTVKGSAKGVITGLSLTMPLWLLVIILGIYKEVFRSK